MAAEEKKEAGTEKKSGLLGKLLLWVIVVIVSVGGGFATPIVVARVLQTATDSPTPSTKKPSIDEEVEFIDFDEIVAVLGKSKFSRYLKINFSLQVARSQRAMVERKITQRKAVLRNRIIAHIAETTEEDLAGQHGHNQLRRQIHAFFNEILFEDGIERIQDVLFRELQVQ